MGIAPGTSRLPQAPHESHILYGYGKIFVYVRILGHISDTIDHLMRFLAENANGSPLGLEYAEHQFQQSGLTTPIRTQDGKEFPVLYFQVHIPKNQVAVIRKEDIFDFNCQWVQFHFHFIPTYTPLTPVDHNEEWVLYLDIPTLTLFTLKFHPFYLEIPP